jgi:predicted ATPase/class 3 adenylate cyclase
MLPTGTVTFLFTDIEGSTRLLQQLGPAYADLLAQHHAVLRAAIQAWHGTEVDSQGDAFFAAFGRASEALRAVAEMQRSLAGLVWSGGAVVKVRMALHTGEAALTEVGYIGLDVHRAARICSVGHGGQVLLSASTQALVALDLPQGVALRSLGEYRLKDLQKPEQIYQLVIPGLPSEFPALKSLDLRPNNLPVLLTSFIGREGEIVAVRQALGKERLVTLIGAGGSGKTRLALQVSAEVLEDFPEGIWFVDLAALSDPVFVPQVVATVLKLHEESGRTIQESLVEHLRAQRVLLILDNCEHLVQACARLAESMLQSCPSLKVLATSREALEIPGEHLLVVPTLSLPKTELLKENRMKNLPIIRCSEAVRLFEERAASVQPGFRLTEENALAAAQICQHLDGIPLAIELAAARIRMLSPAQILARLDDRFHFLTGGSRTALLRQQTLQALVEWSHDLLSNSEKVLFRRLSVFVGGWTLEAAESICEGGELARSTILDLLCHLADKSLVLAEPAGESMRYRMLETIRQFAQARLQAAGEQGDLQRRHLDTFSRFVQESQKGLTGQEPSPWLKMLDAEKDNLYTALTWAIQSGEDGNITAQEMTGGLWMWWTGRGALSEGRQWLQKALEGSQKPLGARAKALAGLAIMVWMQGDLAETSQFLAESLSILRALEPLDKPVLAHAVHIQGHTALDQANYSEAEQAFQESLDLYQELDDPYWVGTLISDLGMVAYHQGDYASARKYQEQSLALFKDLGNNEITSQTLHRLGEIARLEGDYTRAEECYETCLHIYQEMGMKLQIASNLHKLGYVAQYHGDFPKARKRFSESLSIQREAGNKQGIAECLAGLAGLAAVTEQPMRAIRLYAAAQAVLEASNIPLAPADLVEWQRDHARACAQLEQAACDQAREEGQKMGMEQAIEYALQME